MSDLISRRAAIDALEEEPEVWLDDDEYAKGMNAQWKYDRKAIEALPSAQPDLDEHSAWFRIGETLVDESKSHISAQEACQKIREYLQRMKKPERMRGEWVYHTEPLAFRPYGHYTCNLCNEIAWDKSNYCPNCGADMRGDENGN